MKDEAGAISVDRLRLTACRPAFAGRASPVTSHESRVTSHAVAIVLALALTGCDYLPFGYTAIKDIIAAPANFEGKEVKIRGTVKDVVKLPILGQAFVVQEEGADISVMTQGTLPAMNGEVALKGTVKSTAIIGGQSLGLRVEETKRLR